MNNRAVSLSLLMAVIAVFFVQSYVSSIEEEARKKFGTEVLVAKAKRDIKEQETIAETDLELELIPKKFLEPATIFFEKREADEETSKSLRSIGGSVAVVPIKKGEQVTLNKISEPSIRTGLAPQVALGKRAMSVPVNDVSGVSKLVKPGDRVDLVAVITGEGGRENRIAKTVLQDIVILAVGKNVTNNAARLLELDSLTGKEKVRSLTEATNFATVTLEITPEEAQLLALLATSSEGALSLSLRNNDDTDRTRLGAVNMQDLLGPDAAKLPGRTPTNAPPGPGGARR